MCGVYNTEQLEPLCHCMVRNTCYLCHYQELRLGRKIIKKKKNLLQDLLLVFFWIPSAMLLLIPSFFTNYIIFKMSIPQNYTKHLPFRHHKFTYSHSSLPSDKQLNVPVLPKPRNGPSKIWQRCQGGEICRVPSGNPEQVNAACPDETMHGDMAAEQVVLEARPKHSPILF